MKLAKLKSLFRLRPSVPHQHTEAETPASIFCDTHGSQPESFVCQHIAAGLIQRHRVGFFWTQHDPSNPHPDAWCSECEARVKLTGGEWIDEAGEHLKPKIMCGECYQVAKVYHMGGDPWH